MELFNAVDVTKQYGDYKALNAVSIAVPENSVFGLLGPNGAGKTTLIRIINQITAPDKGQLFFNGQPLKGIHTADIGYLPEERGLYKKMKVGEQVLYLAQLKNLSRRDALQRLKYWFEKFGIEDWWDKKVEELSKGMQQKVQFIVTVVHEPRLLIFDEPFSGFDPINTNLLKEEILDLQRKGATIIFSTHNMASVEELCDHIALINKANKILDGSVKSIREEYKTNTFKVQYQSHGTALEKILPAGFELKKKTLDGLIETASICIPKLGSPNHLLEAMLPHTTIHGLEELLPNMNDIFISQVQGNNPDHAMNHAEANQI